MISQSKGYVSGAHTHVHEEKSSTAMAFMQNMGSFTLQKHCSYALINAFRSFNSVLLD